jgi:protein-S-isoprenylcysteine O-methyltransferase Ste14
MKVLGVAPFIAAPTFLCLGLTIIISYLADGMFIITNSGYSILAGAGIILIVIGVLMVISCGRKVLKSFRSGKLMTDSLYRIFRNPMYAAYLIFIIPGICFLFNSWLALTTVIINYILFSIFIKYEHKYLHEKFRKEYEEYLTKVYFKFL